MQTRTKAIALGAIGLGALLWVKRRTVLPHPVGNPDVPEPRKPVDLERYAGSWHEIARYDQGFERGCVTATADYGLLPDGKLSIRNSCMKSNGKESHVEGKAKIVDAETNAKLKVSFLGPLYMGDYWILDHADDYSWSIVGEPSGRALWLLARYADPGRAQVEALINRAKALGYDTSILVRTWRPS
jgi:apolipoprotein D and lipocalin family protein